MSEASTLGVQLTSLVGPAPPLNNGTMVRFGAGAPNHASFAGNALQLRSLIHLTFRDKLKRGVDQGMN